MEHYSEETYGEHLSGAFMISNIPSLTRFPSNSWGNLPIWKNAFELVIGTGWGSCLGH